MFTNIERDLTPCILYGQSDMKFNDLDLSQWQCSNINTDSLWLINARDKSGKHKNIYHGNFIPQVPNQLIRRYTKEGECIFEPFMGSGTTLFECESLNRKYIGFDINQNIIDYVNQTMLNADQSNFYIANCDSMNRTEVDTNFQRFKDSVQFILMHPPYMDIVKFTDNPNDLSQCDNINEFVKKFKVVCENSLYYLDKGRYFALVIGDVYKNSEVLPLGFYCLDMIKRNFKVKLKGIIIKNIEGNRGKLNSGGIWRYRALSSDYYIFKHEYIMVFKKVF
ncbi:DNA methyltransferase [Actinobacillus minor]|uniref:DNA methyltransferase n=1 Tax=Actinobacillus minor TaxID=51047 RepID=UPI0023F32337|nr:DNA methyltransferase [Actinobacillus minor]MDD6910338.1 DNA methyltransferase [Actinobacillus minor]MDY4714262.1 DNA methyltransferase [Actinobacillus minor]